VRMSFGDWNDGLNNPVSVKMRADIVIIICRLDKLLYRWHLQLVADCSEVCRQNDFRMVGIG